MKKEDEIINIQPRSIRLIAICLFVVLVFTISSSAYSNLEINSQNYSGSLTQGVSPGNLTGGNYTGDSASFYQQPCSIFNNSNQNYNGTSCFSFQLASTIGFTPTLSISKPENATYITKLNLPLNFTSTNALYTIYNVDNGTNTTITGNTTFNVSTNGLHTLYLFANNTYGNKSTNITFTVSTSTLFINYSNYAGSTKGDTNDFNQSTYEDLQSVSNVILENTTSGKIKFNAGLNITNGTGSSNSTLNLNGFISILSNNITFNSLALPGLNKSATLYLYSLTFTNPRVLRDGSECPSTICTEINYSGGTFVFSVTSFSNYSAEETSSGGGTVTTTSPGGGGSGGAINSPVFILDKDQISVSLTPGQVKTEEIIITNPGTQVISITIENPFKEFIARGEDTILLNPGESKLVPLYIIVRVDTIPDIYLGKIILTSGSTKKEVLISIEVESEGVLMDVRTEINKNYKKVFPGESILTQMRLFNLGGDSSERKDVEIEYIIKDRSGKEISKETESLAIETQLTFLKEISVPENVDVGSYVLYVRAIYEGKIASSSDNFEVVSSKVSDREKIYIVIIIILVVLLSLVIYHLLLRTSSHGQKRRFFKKSPHSPEKINLRRIMK